MKSRIILMLSFIILTSLGLSAKETARNDKGGWDSREHFYKSKDSFSAYEIEYKGKILVSDDDKNIKSISPDGYLRITKSSFGNSRKIEIESDNQGNLTKKYYDGRKEEAFSPNGEEWLEEILIDVIRKTGIGGKERILRIYNKGGVSAVLDEIDEFERTGNYSYYKSSNHALLYFESIEYSGFNVKYLYYKTLVNELKLNKEELIKVMRAITDVSSNSTKGTLLREILSKYDLDNYSKEKFLDATETLSYNTERGNVLRAFQKKYKIDNDIANEYFDVIDGMSINSEKGNVLKPLLATQDLDNDVLYDLIRSVEDISSNGERAAIYRLIVPHVIGNDELTSRLMMAVKDLGFRYLREELMEYLAKGKVVTDKSLSKAAVLNILDIARSYESQKHKAADIRGIYGSFTNDKEIMDAYFRVIDIMMHEDEMETYNLLLDLVRVQKLDNYGYKLYLEAAEEIADRDYKHGASALLRAVAMDMPNDPDLLEQFFETLEEIDHNSGKEEIIRMFCDKGKLDKRTVVYLLKAVEDIEVDIEKATSLQRIKQVMPKDDELKYIFNSVADEIKSDYEYERAMN